MLQGTLCSHNDRRARDVSLMMAVQKLSLKWWSD